MTFAHVRTGRITPVVQGFSIVGRTPIYRCFAVCTERSRDEQLAFSKQISPGYSDGTQVIEIPLQSKTNAKRGAKPITRLMTH